MLEIKTVCVVTAGGIEPSVTPVKRRDTATVRYGRGSIDANVHTRHGFTQFLRRKRTKSTVSVIKRRAKSFRVRA
jgi:hypothetical protein